MREYKFEIYIFLCTIYIHKNELFFKAEPILFKLKLIKLQLKCAEMCIRENLQQTLLTLKIVRRLLVRYRYVQ